MTPDVQNTSQTYLNVLKVSKDIIYALQLHCRRSYNPKYTTLNLVLVIFYLKKRIYREIQDEIFDDEKNKYSHRKHKA